MPRRVRLSAWLAFFLHGILVLTTRYRLSYDAYNHMFFGDHYRLDWWSLWDTRWYTGFEVTSYPPLVHQLIGLLGHITGVDAAFGLLLWLVLSIYPVAVYAFCRIFTGKTVASYAALSAALLPSIYQAAHTFGQLPTLTGTLFALLAMACLNDYLLNSNRLSGILAVVLIGTVMAAHHATLLFLPWALAAMVIHLLLNSHVKRSILLWRLFVFILLAALTGLVVIWPFWVWGQGQLMQVSIDHPSRHNFFTDPLAPGAFFLPVYGALIPLIPFVIFRKPGRSFVGLWLSFLVLFVLGLGGTTPLPRLLFGPGWEWLTYDRFAFWASLLLLPFFGMMMVLVRKNIHPWLARHLPKNKLRADIQRSRFVLVVICALGLTSIIAGLLPTLLPTQPVQVDMQPIVDFLAKNNRWQWRYLTFGLGDQLAYLSRLTDATTIDGSYHTARNLPELRVSGLGQIDTAYWIPGGLARLDPILQESGQRGVRWGFVNRKDYIPILGRNGWVQLFFLKNGVQVWENPRAIVPPEVRPPDFSPLMIFSWGVLPISVFVIALALGGLRLWPERAVKVLYAIHSIGIGLLPVALSFWYYRTLFTNDHPNVYFSYDQILFFISDGIAVTAVFCSIIACIFEARLKEKPYDLKGFLNSRLSFSSITFWFFCLCVLATLSVVWSVDKPTSLYFSLHLWLVFGLFLSLENRPHIWISFAIGTGAALALQSMTGIWQFAFQSTAFLKPLGLNWPGDLSPAEAGTSVVQLASGIRWLRVYGTLPHPNILGGLIFVFIAGLTALYFASKRLWPVLLPMIGMGLILLVLTFSRSAWLAEAVFMLILVLRARYFNGQRLRLLALISLTCLVLVAVPLRELIFTRSGAGTAISTEDFSSRGRAWLMQESFLFIRERPWTGMGMGNYILELAERAPMGYIVEPVHNVILLAASELGVGGVLLLAGLAVSIGKANLSARQPVAIIFAALALGLGLISMFDHYLWTLAPGRMLAGLILGLLAGQIRRTKPLLSSQLT